MFVFVLIVSGRSKPPKHFCFVALPYHLEVYADHEVQPLMS